MPWIQLRIQRKDGAVIYPPPSSSSTSPPYAAASYGKQSLPSSPAPSSSGTKITPAVLFVIVILAVLFFVSGVLHLLVRFLTKQPSSSSSQSNAPPEISESDRQLQQLFHLHDSGLDQTFIDALPVFHFKEIEGLKEQVDCAVCLSEFSGEDKLRWLPACSHAFHINCIDTWLLSNSSCPLCRGTVFSPGFPMENLNFYFQDPKEEDGGGGDGEDGASVQKNAEIQEGYGEEGVVPVRLGKFRNMNAEADADRGETSSSSLDARRCYSMGSYQYVVRDAFIRVAPGNRGSAMGEDSEGRRNGLVSKGDSFSVSKIWMWSNKERFGSSSGNQNVELPWMRERAMGMN